MSVSSAFKDYYSLVSPTLYKQDIGLAAEGTPLRFTYGEGCYCQFDPYYNFQGWEGRKVLALPKAILVPTSFS